MQKIILKIDGISCSGCPNIVKKYPVNYAVSLLILTIGFLIYGFDIIISGIKK